MKQRVEKLQLFSPIYLALSIPALFFFVQRGIQGKSGASGVSFFTEFQQRALYGFSPRQMVRK